ncbi:helix-turn-helix domain-containing protein [Streptomyces sp. NPDC056465]|uniref:helix-turn-helix domain-containing protein n=1 Tax=Streptomyces sp. NPDC056465 TaxID=3345829 RepID=UPI0036775A77
MAARVISDSDQDAFSMTLRDLFAESGVTGDELAEHMGMSRTALTDVLNGQVIPGDMAVREFADAMGLGKASTDELLQMKHRARSAVRVPRGRRHNPRRNFVPRFGQPDPIRASGPADLQEALRAVHVWAGAPSLRKLERASDGMLRRSTISDMLNGKDARLPEYDRYLTFLLVCGMDQASLDVWVYTWRRLLALEKSPEISSWMGGMSPASIR